MKKLIQAVSISIGLVALCLPMSHTLASDNQNIAAASATPLFEVIAALDTEVFDSFNHCAEAKQLQKHEGFFAPDVEFYHDNGGVTWNRQTMIANTKKNACGNYRRELVADSLKVFPIKNFGAIAQGVHRFCSIKTEKCEGMADFVMVWRSKNNHWALTRVLSYGHRSNE